MYSHLLPWGHFHTPKNDTAQIKTGLLVLLVILLASWAALDHSKRQKPTALQNEGLAM